MKNLLIFSLLITGMPGCHHGLCQGWVAEVNLDLNHSLYAYEKILNATVTYSGVTKSGSSETSQLHLVLRGSGPVTGGITLSASGLAWEPYYETEPPNKSIVANFSGNYTDYCTSGLFKSMGENPNEEIHVRIKVYPRQEIAEFRNECESFSLSLNPLYTCSAPYVWEVSESISRNYKVIPGKAAAAITITRDELEALGFDRPFGKIYFRATGRSGTTSQIQTMDIYYPPPAASVTVTYPKCHGAADGSVQVEIESPDAGVINDFLVTLFPEGPGNNSQQILTDESTATLEGIAAGNYRIKIENTTNVGLYGGCWTEFPIEAVVDPPRVTIPEIDISNYNGYSIKCEGGNEGTIKAKPSGGTGEYTSYEWTPDVSTTDYADELQKGTYSIRAKDSNDCWSEWYSTTLTGPKQLSATLLSTGGKNGYDVSCHDEQDGEIATEVSGGVAPYTYSWSDGNTTPSLSGKVPGTYTLTVTDGNGCSTVESSKLMAPDSITFDIAEISGIKCAGDQSGILEVQSIRNVIGQVYFLWSSGESNREIANKGPGLYSVTVSDDQGCSAKKNYTLPEPEPWSVDVIATSDYNGSPVSCSGKDNGSLAAIVRDENNNIVPAESYTWYKNGSEFISGRNVSVIDNLTAGVYRARISYQSFCKAEKVFLLNEPDPVVAQIAIDTTYNGLPVSCLGATDGSIQALAAGGTGDSYTYSWENKQTGPHRKDLGAGTYLVIAWDINGCDGKAEMVLNDPDPVEVQISVLSNHSGQPISCTGAHDGFLRAFANGGASFFNYAWNTGQDTQDLTDIPAGQYSVTATDANGCEATIDTTLTNPQPVKAQIPEISNYNGFGVSCRDSNDGYLASEASGGTEKYDYHWLGSSHRQALYKNLPAGTYTLRVNDENGCTDTIESIITEPPALILKVVDFKNASCNNAEDGAIELLATGGTGDYKFSRAGESWQQESLLTDLPAGVYHPAARDANGCLQSTTQVLTEPEKLAIYFEDVEPARCGEPVGKISALVTGGSGSYYYKWTGPENYSFQGEPRVTGLRAGIYTLNVADENSCVGIESTGITSTDGPKAEIVSIVSATCSYSTDGSAALEVAEGNGPFTFLWEDGQTTAEPVNLRKGKYLVEISDADQCTVVESVTIPAPDSLEIELTKKTEPACNGDCNGKLTVLAKGGNGGYIYDWGEFTGDEADQLCAGRYVVTAADEKGCTSEKTFELLQPEPLSMDLVSSQSPACAEGCDGELEVAVAGGTGNLEYQWSMGMTDPAITNLCAGTYSITVMDENRCTLDEDFILENPEGQSLDLGGSIMLCEGQTHILDPGSNWESFLWASNTGFKSSSRRVTISAAGMYWLKVVTGKGCEVQDTFLLQTSTDLLNANFLVASQAATLDTVVMIDISWPLPQHSIWDFPPMMERVADFGDMIYGRFEEPGSYDVTLLATLGDCRDEITKTVTITNADLGDNEGRLGHEPIVKNFTLYPNPNDGLFHVRVEFRDESPIVISVWNTLTARKLAQLQDSGAAAYVKQIDLRPLSPGNYTLRLDYGKGVRYKRLIVR